MQHIQRVVSVVVLVAVCGLASAALALGDAAPSTGQSPAASYPWAARIAAADRYAAGRAGRVGFAVVDESGKLVGGRSINTTFRSASVAKAMLMVCYLDEARVRNRPLTAGERGLLAPMIRRSDDASADRVWTLDSPSCLRRIAARVGMRDFSTGPVWGLTQITPAGTARMFFRIDALVAPRHRAYAMQLLRSIIPSQRWGLATVVPSGWTIAFKGGFVGPVGARVENQGALFTLGDRRFAVSVLTNDDPSHAYGIATERGIGARLLAGYPS